jgi:hypothetical protein
VGSAYRARFRALSIHTRPTSGVCVRMSGCRSASVLATSPAALMADRSIDVGVDIETTDARSL